MRQDAGKKVKPITWIVVCAALLFLGALLYHSRVETAVRANLGEENRAKLTLYLLDGAIRIKSAVLVERDFRGKLRLRFFLNDKLKSIPSAKKRQPKKVPAKQARPSAEPAKKQRFKLPRSVQRYMVKHLDLKSFGLSMTIGVSSDAAVTAQLCGLALTVLESASGVVRALKPNARVLMRVSANYIRDCLKLRFSCIAGIKLGHLICIAAMLAAYLAKGAFTQWLIQSKMSCAPRWKTSRT